MLKQKKDGGISEFMRRMGGYTYYFNLKYKRSGALFQGRFKAVYVSSNNYILRLSVYINLNSRVHRLGSSRFGSLGSRTSKSSWDEYVRKIGDGFCNKDIILKQFKNIVEYQEFAEGALKNILAGKEQYVEMEKILLE